MSSERLARLIGLTESRIPGFHFVTKDNVGWMRLLARLLRPINPRFGSDFNVALGKTVYLTKPKDDWHPDSLSRLLAHELVHLIDQKHYGVFFYLSYGLLLPSVRTCRAHWELRAYAVDLLLAWETGGEAALLRTANRVTNHLTGPAYGWMWLGQRAARRLLAPTLQSIRTGELQKRDPYLDIIANWRGPSHSGIINTPKAAKTIT